MTLNSSLFSLGQLRSQFPSVAIVGVGDEGDSILSQVFEHGGSGAQCIAVNTDKASLENVYSHEKVLVQLEGIDDLETGSHSDVEGKATRACVDSLAPLLAGADVAFIVATMREPSTAVLASAVAEVARRIGAVTVGMAIMPSPFEREMASAYRGLARIRKSCNTAAIVSINHLRPFLTCSQDMWGDMSDQPLVDLISDLSGTLACPNVVNTDPVAFRELMAHGGIAHLGIAQSSSVLKVEEATVAALRRPLLYDSISRSRGALLVLHGGSGFAIEEAEMAADLVTERVGWNTPVLLGARVDESWDEGVQVSILLTGGAYPYVPGGYRRLPLEMYEMENDSEEHGLIDVELDLDQLEES